MSELRVEKIRWYHRLRSSWYTLLKLLITRTNMWLLVKSNGRLGNSFLGKSVLLLHSVGSKSGLPRVTPLFYLQDAIISFFPVNGRAQNRFSPCLRPDLTTCARCWNCSWRAPCDMQSFGIIT